MYKPNPLEVIMEVKFPFTIIIKYNLQTYLAKEFAKSV